jgi:hypothetical protein
MNDFFYFVGFLQGVAAVLFLGVWIWPIFGTVGRAIWTVAIIGTILLTPSNARFLMWALS